jgi:hypothetical protein
LELTPPAGNPPAKRNGKGDRTTNPDIKHLLDAASAACVEFQGFKPVIPKGVAGKAMAALLSGRSFEEAAQVVTEFYRDPPDWNREKDCLGLEHIPRAADKILARIARGGNGKRDATGAPVGEHREFVEDTVEVDSEGVRRLVRIKRDANTQAELGRTWGRPALEALQDSAPPEAR